MRILLDECLPRKLKRLFRPHSALTVADAGWGGLKNGALLSRAAPLFDVFATVDSSMEHQQQIAAYDLVFVLFEAPSNDYDDLAPLVPEALERLPGAQPGTVLRIRSRDRDSPDNRSPCGRYNQRDVFRRTATSHP
jgi:hypothetical protein